MLWPVDHPLHTDERLVPWASAASQVCERAGARTAGEVLRHVVGRRMTATVDLPAGPAIVKVFGSPRARGNLRRLRVLASTDVASLIPMPLDGDASGHVALLSWWPGSVLDQVDDATFEAAAEATGLALRRLHDAPVCLDRSWGLDEEIDQLRRRVPPSLRPLAARIIARSGHLGAEVHRPAHRDFHPRQLVLATPSAVRMIDLDDATMAPPALDVGNFLAHLLRDAALGRRDSRVSARAADGFRAAYGPVEGDVDNWCRLALVRLAGLAETRHGSPADRRLIAELVAAP